MKTSRIFFTTLLAICAVSLAGCVGGKRGGGGSGEGYGADADSVTGIPLADRDESVSFLGSNVDRNRFDPIYFAFDSSSIGAGERGKIEQVANFLRGASNTIIVAGFTDERGTPEYNRGLGERRAQTVREALVRAGANASRIQTVSFGAEMPADNGSGESAWAKNRRAEFGVVR
jgi:peptidoglycan-associated lipoprotein